MTRQGQRRMQGGVPELTAEEPLAVCQGLLCMPELADEPWKPRRSLNQTIEPWLYGLFAGSQRLKKRGVRQWEPLCNSNLERKEAKRRTGTS
jgi:hypothetical protein